MKDLKDYVVEFKKGNIEVISQLIGKRLEREINNSGSEDLVERLKFNDKALDSIYWKICKKYKYIDYKDLDNYIHKAFFDIKDDDTVSSVFDNADLSRTPQEILEYVKIKLEGYVANEIIKQDKDYYSITTPDEFENRNVLFGDDEEQDSTFKKSDFIIFKEFTSIDDIESAYQEFIEYIGGDVRNLLSDKQNNLFNLMQDLTLTQNDIGEELGITQQAISDMRKAMVRRIRKKYYEFITINRVKKDKDTYRTIKGFLQQHLQIITYDLTDSFDYFGYFIHFLKSNYKDDEEKISPEDLHRNKSNYTYTIIDVVSDYVNSNTYRVVKEYIFKDDSNLILTKRNKDSFVMNILKGFNKYVIDVEKSVGGLSEKIAKQGEKQKYIDLLI